MIDIRFIDEVDGVKREIIDEAGGPVCNFMITPITVSVNGHITNMAKVFK